MKVVFTPRAKAALKAIGDYIAEDNRERASSFVRELREKAEGLSDFPRRFPTLPGHERRGVRHRVHGNYVILYEVDEPQVTILTIMHGARDYARRLGPQD